MNVKIKTQINVKSLHQFNTILKLLIYPIARVIFLCIYSVNDWSLSFNVSIFCFVSFNANGNVITIASDIEIPIANISRNGSIFFGMRFISALSAR